MKIAINHSFCISINVWHHYLSCASFPNGTTSITDHEKDDCGIMIVGHLRHTLQVMVNCHKNKSKLIHK